VLVVGEPILQEHQQILLLVLVAQVLLQA